MNHGRAADWNAEADKAGRNRIDDVIACSRKLLNDGGVERAFAAELVQRGFDPRVTYLPHACILKLVDRGAPTFTNVYDGKNCPEITCREVITLGLPWSWVQLTLHDRMFHFQDRADPNLPIGQSYRLQHLVFALGPKFGDTMRSVRRLDEKGKVESLTAIARKAAPMLTAYLQAKGPCPKDMEMAIDHFTDGKGRINLHEVEQSLWMLYQADKLEAAITFSLLQPKESAGVPKVLQEAAGGDFGDWLRFTVATGASLADVLREALTECAKDFHVGTDLCQEAWRLAGGSKAFLDGKLRFGGGELLRRQFLMQCLRQEALADGRSAEDAERDVLALEQKREDLSAAEFEALVWQQAGVVMDRFVTRRLQGNRVRASVAFVDALRRAGKVR